MQSRASGTDDCNVLSFDVNTNSPEFAIDFGQDGNSHLFRKEGWSEPEPRYTWTAGLASNLELPRPNGQGEYLLELNVHPFISDGKIPTQKLRVIVNDLEVGNFDIRVTSSLECLIPWNLLESRPAIAVKFVHPFAASRHAISGVPDERLIALAFQRVSLRKLHDTPDKSTPDARLDNQDTGAAKIAEQNVARPSASVMHEGHIDAYAYHAPSASWWFVGWASQSWHDDEVSAVTACFQDRNESGETLAGFYDRPGLEGRGRGLIAALRGKPKKKQLNKSSLISLKIETTKFTADIDGHAKEPLAPNQLPTLLGPIFAENSHNTDLAKLFARLSANTAPLDLSAYTFDGHLDLHAYDPAIGGWLCAGWVAQPWNAPATPVTATARHGDFERHGELIASFFDRPDIRGRGIGCILFMPETSVGTEWGQKLSSLEIDTRTSRLRLRGNGQGTVSLRKLVATLDLRGIEGFEGIDRLPLKSTLLQYKRQSEAFTRVVEGHVDFYGYHSAAQGWLFCGWISSAWEDERAPAVVARFADGDISGDIVATFYRRDDIAGRGVGMVLLLRSASDNRQRPLSLEFEFADAQATIVASIRPPYSASELRDALAPLLLQAELVTDRGGLRTLVLGEAEVLPEPVRAAPTAAQALDGHIDFYGYHPETGAWFFCGWLSKPWGEDDKPTRVIAYFENGSVSSETTLATFYYRDDVGGRGVGFILAMMSPKDNSGHLVSLNLSFATFSATLKTTAANPGLPARELIEWLSPLLTGGEANSNRSRLQAILLPEKAEARRRDIRQGYIDFYGYHSIAGGWLFCGWVSTEAYEMPDSMAIIAQFERGELRGEAIWVHYAREDLGDRGLGLVVFISGAGNPLGGLLSVTIAAESSSFRIYPGTEIQRLREQELISGLRTIVAGAPAGAKREAMLRILRRQGFVGTDTVGELGERIFLEFDEIIVCEPDGLLLIGWYLAKPGVVRSLRVRCGALVSTIDLDHSVRIERPDVLSSVGQQHGFDDAQCGFIAFLPHAVDGTNTPYIEIETKRGDVGYRPIPAPKLSGIAATKRLLECFDVRFLDVPRAYDNVVGPAVELLTRSRLKTRPKVTALEFGALPIEPEFTVIIPLYGRIDFVEYQMALFSAHAPNRNVEFLYVLDDPPKRREAQFLFTSVFERLRMPFRALLFDHNVGFAPANNIGLQHARGKYVCFLNSDAFPGTPDWLARLAARLAARPDLGVIGPLLLYEDGSIQHQGMSFRRLNEFGDWHFGHHPGKGLQPRGLSGSRECISITGACMLMERELAERMQGLDESYAIGDFEDSDLCLRLHRMGLTCAVDLDVHLYHLERKSQGTAARNWRMNLTLYNAWLHERRWARTIAEHPLAFAVAPPVEDSP